MDRLLKAVRNIFDGRTLVGLGLLLVVPLVMLTIPTFAALLLILAVEGGSELRRLWVKWLGDETCENRYRWHLVAANLGYGLMLFSLLWLRLQPQGFARSFQVVVAVWSFDTFALIGGSIAASMWETVKIYPQWSPKKSLEGALVGLAVGIRSLAISPKLLWVIGHWIVPLLPNAAKVDTTPVFTLTPLNIGIFVVALLVGHAFDFLKSKLKRNAGVKDAGFVFLAHGGVLDRFDSLPAAGLIIAALIPTFTLLGNLL